MPDTEPGRWVPPATDPRRALVQLFRGYRDPFWSVTVDVDVTGLHEASRARGGPSFFLASLFASMRAANAVPEFRRRLRPQGVWEHARVGVGSTILRGDDTFAFAYFPWSDDFPRFEEAGRREIERVEASDGPADPRDDRDDLIHHSVLPWLDFTSFTNAHRGADDSTPKVVFGRHVARAERRAMAVAVEVHHALTDGLHVSRYVDALRSELTGWG
ncbi:MAG TPA: CatA-like O-acetyltransferase [Longimicrobiales bacterium]|nr:CatA-like O-acetyltransferase [Longimicrobiales bacterium]